MKKLQYKDQQELMKVNQSNQSKQLKLPKLDTTELKSLAAAGVAAGRMNIPGWIAKS